MLLLLAVGVIVASAVPRLAEPRPSTDTALGVTIMAGSALATGGLAVYLRRRARATTSGAVPIGN